MNAHSKHSAQASISLYSMRGKSWSYYQKHVANLIGESGGVENTQPHLLYLYFRFLTIVR